MTKEEMTALLKRLSSAEIRQLESILIGELNARALLKWVNLKKIKKYLTHFIMSLELSVRAIKQR